MLLICYVCPENVLIAPFEPEESNTKIFIFLLCKLFNYFQT